MSNMLFLQLVHVLLENQLPSLLQIKETKKVSGRMKQEMMILMETIVWGIFIIMRFDQNLVLTHKH